MKKEILNRKILNLGKRFLCQSMKGFSNNYPELVPTNFETGNIPRCLYYEADKGSSGCFAVGLNPGQINIKEAAFYQRENQR